MTTLEKNRALKLMIIEDETHLLEALQELFGDTYDVTALASMEEALRKLQDGFEFDVIISDMNLPVKNGRDLYQLLKARGHGEEKKIIFMTAGIFTADLAEWYDSIPNRKFSKPFNIGSLREVLGSLG